MVKMHAYLSLAGLLLLAATATAQDADKPIREIFVPFEDLNIILETQAQRVFLSRQEYDALVEKAKTKPQANVPHKLALVAAEYEGTLEEGRAVITGNLTIDVLDDGLFALPLEVAGVGIRSAVLDGKPAPLSLDPNQRPVLLLEGKGQHKLTLGLTAPLQTAAAQQSLSVTLPTTTAARLKLAVPGNVEVKGGAAVIDRQFDMAANVTRLELLPQKGGMSIVLSLNNRLLQDQRVVVARSVLVDEVTQGYERIHATVSYRVLHGAVEKLRLAIPAGFEVTKVDATQLARWEEKTEEGRKILEATLREPVSDQIVLGISANRSPAADQDWLAALGTWQFPRLEPLDVAGQVAVVGLLVEDRLQPENIQATGLLPIDANVLVGAIPASVLNAEPGAPSVRQVVTYYAPAATFDLTARFTRPPAGLKVATNTLLVIGDRNLTLSGGFALNPMAEDLFDFRFTVPAQWQVTAVTRADGTPLAIERFPTANGGQRVIVRLASGIPAGKSATVNFEAISTPTGWLSEWTTQAAEYPQVVVEGATLDTGAVAAQTLDDLIVRPGQLAGLTPLLETEKAAFGLADLPTALAYRFQGRPFSLALAIERKAPSIMAEVFSFFRIERDNLVAHYELNYDVREARTRRLYFLLPKETPTEIAVRGLDSTVVREFRSNDDGASRRWEVQLAERQLGRVRLAVDFQMRYDDLSLSRLGLPLIQATEVEYQSALVAVEGDEELDLTLSTTARPVDVGELAAADHQVGRRVIGAFGYVGDQSTITVQVSRRDPYALPPALVQKAQLQTKVDVAGRSQSLAQYALLTKATLLEVQLPPGSTLWTISLDGQPTKPQREGESLLLSLPAQAQLTARNLKVVYESPGNSLGFSGTVTAVAPTLLVRAAGTDAEREIPQADLEWTLYLPSGYVLRRANGTVFTDAIEQRDPAAFKVARFLYELAGGIRPFYTTAREASRKSQLEQIVTNFSTMDGSIREYYADKSAATSERAPAPVVTAATPPAASELMDSVTEATPAPADPFGLPMSQPPMAAPEPALPPAAEVPQAMPTEGNAQAGATPATAQPAVPQRAINTEGEEAGTYAYALTGVSSLRIDLQSDHGEQAAVFRSLGTDPELRAAVIDNRRVDAAAWGLSLLVLLVGVGLTFQPAHRRASYVIVVLLASSLPLLLTEAFDDVAQVFDYVFYAGCVLAVYYPLAACCLACSRWVKSKLPAEVTSAVAEPPAPAATTAGLLVGLLLIVGGSQSAVAQDPNSVRIVNIKELLPLLEGTPSPIEVPKDAVIIPYDPDKLDQAPASDKLLVPYERYVDLWNRANPDKKIVPAVTLPADYALAGAAYQATLGSSDSLEVRGTIEIDVFSDKPVAVPLHLSGGVLVKATVDGGAAKLQIVGAEHVSTPKPAAKPQELASQQVAAAAPNSPDAPLPPRLLLLHLSGKGRKKLEVTLQLGMSRQGGWRVVRGQLPVGPATALTLLVPTVGTEIRQQGLADRATFETKAENERIETSLGTGGLVDLQWRPKVTEGQVDQSLTARSTAVLDVREDSLRLVWQVNLEFGRAFRDAFTFAVPAGYLVEQVTGDNIRGWTAKTVATEQTLDVTLLKPAQGSATVTIQLARRGQVGQGDLAEFNAPSVLVVDAALQQGEITVRRSPRLDLRTVSATGLARADSAGGTAAVEQLADATDAAVLNVKPFQTFRYVRPPFALRLAATELAAATTADVRMALRVAERDTTLDAAVVFRTQGQPLYRVEMFLPQGFELDRLGPGDLEWAVTTENDRRKLTVHLLDGRTGEFTLTLFGRIVGVGDPPNLDGEPKTRTIPAPVMEVLNVQKQEGDLVVLPDPDTDVRVEELKNADKVLLMQAVTWLAADQQPLAKGAIRFRSSDYAARLVLTPRTPQVWVRTITNVKVTPRAVEETILLNFRIEQAGIRRLSFLLPEALAKARLNVKLLKNRTVEPATDAAGQPIAGWVRFKLELQDYVRDQFGVIVMSDRLLTADKQPIAIPQVETGRTEQRLAAVENTSRDEVVPVDTRGLEPLSPQQQAWRDLTAILGSNITQAWQVSDAAAAPTLTFEMRERKRAETAAARIDLATTVMVVDAAGTYRALQEYRITNATEQFLEVQMPAGSRLWTVTVAGQPVKPLVPPPAAGQTEPPAGIVRIPLVKTAEGEGDYPVQLKYGGRLPEVTSLAQVRFPLMRTININVELSQVKLLLPESHEWFDFRGTMRKVTDEGELAEVFQTYLSKRIQEASELLTSANPYTQIRAQSNLKQAKLMLDSSRSMSENNLRQLGMALQSRNDVMLAEAEKKAQTQAAEQTVDEGVDNRSRLNSYWFDQSVKRSKNVVSGLKSNFDAVDDAEASKPRGDAAFNKGFFDQNALGTKGEAGDPKAGEPAKAPAGEGKPGGRFFRGSGKEAADDAPQMDDSGGQGQNPQLFNDQQRESAQKKLQQEVDEVRDGQAERSKSRENFSRYGAQLEQQAQQQELFSLNDELRAGGGQQAAGQQPGGGPGGLGPQQSGGAMGMGGMGGGMGSGFRAPNAPPPGTPPLAYQPPGMAPNGASQNDADVTALATSGEDFSDVAAGLASLDFTLPERGQEFNFTTPRGQIEIEARPVAQSLLARLMGLAIVAGVIVVVWLVARRPAREFWRMLFGTVASGVLLAIIGLASIISGILPLAGLALLVIGIVLAIRNRAWPRPVVVTQA
jgi:hypothetical protein